MTEENSKQSEMASERKIRPLLQVNQWLPTWSGAKWGTARPQPPATFYVGSIALKALRALSGVRTRTLEDRRIAGQSAGYQRSHDEERLSKIGRYLEYGFPLSTERGLDPAEHLELINPGWLPTAILVNVIGEGSTRNRRGEDRCVLTDHLVRISKRESEYVFDFPIVTVDPEKQLPPLEIIDGQHRLLATDLINLPDEYEVPVVVFDNLPLTWQAYLFWVINVEPKRINTSLAFDLYPELRDQEWLKRGESIKIYQEHRSQELVEVLWRHPASPWKDRIELFGKRVEGHVSNAAAIRSLMATFVRTWPKAGEGDADDIGRLGGLFGSIDRNGSRYIISWRRPEQAAFLILCWICVRDGVSRSQAYWVNAVASALEVGRQENAVGFSSAYSLLATDQGFRAVSFVFNALGQILYDRIGLLQIEGSEDESEPSEAVVSEALNDLRKNHTLVKFLGAVAEVIVDGVDWRTSATPGMPQDDKVRQAQYRGSSGYKALNKAALHAALLSPNKLVQEGAAKALAVLGWDNE